MAVWVGREKKKRVLTKRFYMEFLFYFVYMKRGLLRHRRRRPHHAAAGRVRTGGTVPRCLWADDLLGMRPESRRAAGLRHGGGVYIDQRVQAGSEMSPLVNMLSGAGRGEGVRRRGGL